MKISDLLNESQQLNELTGKDIGRGVGKVAKGIGAVAGGIAGIPGAVKKGFQAGKKAVGGAAPAAKPQAVAKPATPTAEPQAAPADNTAAPASAEPTAEPQAQAAPSAKAAPAAEPAAPEAGVDVAAIKQELTSFLQTYKKDLAMQNKNWNFVVPKVNALEKQVADLVAKKSKPAAGEKTKKPSQAEIDADRERVMGMTSDSVIRTGRAVTESFQLFRKK